MKPESQHASLKSILDRARRLLMPGGGAARVGRVTAIFVADGAGEMMQARDQVHAIVDAGLEADRYASGRGFWRLTDGCQVTLIRDEDLRRAERRHGLGLAVGQHRRNLVVAGISSGELRGCSLRVGTALLEWHRVRPPCGYLDRVSGPGTAKALGSNAGHCFRVREAGLIKVGDKAVRLPLQ